MKRITGYYLKRSKARDYLICYKFHIQSLISVPKLHLIVLQEWKSVHSERFILHLN